MDTWTTGGKSGKKSKKVRRGLGQASDSSASPLPPLSQSETPTSPPGSVANGDVGCDHMSAHSSLFSSEGLSQLVNGVTDPQPQRVPNGKRRTGGKPAIAHQRPNSVPMPMVNGGGGHPGQKSHSAAENPHLDAISKKKGLLLCMDGLMLCV